MLVALLALSACGPTDARLPADTADDAADTGGNTDTGTTDGLSLCDLTPPLSERVEKLAVDGAGVVWSLGISGDLTRYAPADATECVLTGEVVETSVEDVVVSDDDVAVVHVGLTVLEVFAADGTRTFTCEPDGLGHAMAVNPAASILWTWPVGSTQLTAWDITSEACAPYPDLDREVARPMSTSASMSGTLLYVENHLDEDDIPGSRYDLETGELLNDLGLIETEDVLEQPGLASALVAREVGSWWIDGDLWSFDDDGWVVKREEGDELLPGGGYFTAGDRRELGPLYLSAMLYESDAEAVLLRRDVN